MTELMWFLFGAWVGASIISIAFTALVFKLKPWKVPDDGI